MGNKKSKPTSKDELDAKKFFPIKNTYETLSQVQDGLKEAGLESSNLIVGIDFTASNEDTGRISFNGQCLHKILDGGKVRSCDFFLFLFFLSSSF
jgi:hypothetical protein